MKGLKVFSHELHLYRCTPRALPRFDRFRTGAVWAPGTFGHKATCYAVQSPAILLKTKFLRHVSDLPLTEFLDTRHKYPVRR